ncbi:MAG: tetratricopeptide repeat protein [Firmicutes bacterium]|nr:tetratricopeptide repeat protein [Bacillota bacterium]
MFYSHLSQKIMASRGNYARVGNLRAIAFFTVTTVLILIVIHLLFYGCSSHAATKNIKSAGSAVNWESILDTFRGAPEEELQAHLMMAVAYANLGMIPEATREFRIIDAAGYNEFGKRIIRENRKRVEDSPEDIISLNLLGFAYYAFGNYSESLYCFQSLLELDPMNVWIHHYYAYCLSRVDRMDEAVEILKAAARIDPSNSYTHLLLGLAYRENRQYLLSIFELARAGKAISELAGLADH